MSASHFIPAKPPLAYAEGWAAVRVCSALASLCNFTGRLLVLKDFKNQAQFIVSNSLAWKKNHPLEIIEDASYSYLKFYFSSNHSLIDYDIYAYDTNEQL